MTVKLSAVLFIWYLRFYYINLTKPHLKFLASAILEIWIREITKVQKQVTWPFPDPL